MYMIPERARMERLIKRKLTDEEYEGAKATLIMKSTIRGYEPLDGRYETRLIRKGIREARG